MNRGRPEEFFGKTGVFAPLHVWNLEGDFADAIGEVDLTYTSAPKFVTGLFGRQAALFDGVSNCLYTEEALKLAHTNKVTVLANWYPNVYDTANLECMFELGTDIATVRGTFAMFTNGQAANTPVRNYVIGDANINYKQFNQGTYTWTTPQWWSLASVFDMSQAAADELMLYSNRYVAKPDDTASANNNTSNFVNYPLYIGGRNNAQYFANHTWQNIAVFDRALAPSEIREYYRWSFDLPIRSFCSLCTNKETL